MEKKWLIVVDLDGTALADHQSLNESTVKVLKQAVKKGHVVCIATGRPPRNALKFYNELELNTIMANYNGAFIDNPSDKTFLPMNMMLNNVLIEEFMRNKEIRSHIGHWMIERQDEIVTNQKEGILFDHFFVKDEITDIVSDEKEFVCNLDQNSVILQIKDATKLWKVKELFEKYKSSITIRPWSLTDSKFGMLEINPRRGNKGNAIKFMSEYYNIPMNRTIAFGDMPNDLEMIQKAGVGIVMGNGHRELKEHANIILEKTNKEDAIKEFLEHNLGI